MHLRNYGWWKVAARRRITSAARDRENSVKIEFVHTSVIGNLGWIRRSARRTAAFASSFTLMFIPAASGANPPRFETDILPVFKARCFACHNGAAPQAGLNLSARESIVTGGKSGPAIVPGFSEKSLLVEKILSKTMPPVEPKLTDEQISLIRMWIDKGDSAPAVKGPVVSTESDVLPIFQMRCVVCHGKRKQEGGLDLRFQATRLKGGRSGPALVPGKPEESLILQKILSGQMPPPKLLIEAFVRPPSSAEVEKLRKWIADGALPGPKEAADDSEDRQVSDQDAMFWSFQPPKRPTVPSVRHRELVRNPVDAFLLQKLEAANLSFSPEAGRPVLMRRAYLDLIGLPPSPEQIDEYLNDNRPGAYERMIDRLLASPHYGERWAKFWLDAAGYSDSEGVIDEDLVRGNSWRYRDYVIRSLNRDKPFDQFLCEQIAGDEMVHYQQAKQLDHEGMEKLVATGFLRMVSDGTYSPANGSIAERINVIADELEVLGSAVFGLTIGCARCHNHKYDPIPQRDYYRLSAILQTAYDPYDWVKPTDRYLDFASETERKEVAVFNAPIEAEIKKVESARDEKAKPLRAQVLQQRLSVLPESVREDLKTAVAISANQRTPTQKYLVEKFGDTLNVSDEDLEEKFPQFNTQTAEFRKKIDELKKKLREKPQIRALYEMGGEPSGTYLLHRGDAQQVGEAVKPGVPSVLKAGLASYRVVPPWPEASGRRLALARWLVQPSHPLTARVMVNRLWMHHFGKGIVASPSNFGHTGVPPSHPELLDWLATEFVRTGWSMKAMHRLMVTSTAYRQQSRMAPEPQSADPDNTFLSRMALRRMDAEQLHDSVLQVTGELNLAQFGPSIPVETLPRGEIVAQGSQKEGWRRAVYVLERRTTPATMLEVFDLPRMSPNCIQRSYSTVSTQALQMMNSEVIRQRSRYFAGRLIDQFDNNREKQIEQIYLRTFARRPTAEETTAAVRDLSELDGKWSAYLENQKSEGPRASTSRWYALADLCQAVLSSAEFAYIE
jgi:mono/diheme cytochrome c family protein